LEELGEGELEEIAKQLGLETEGGDIKKLVKDEIDKINSNKQKLSNPDTGLAGLIDKDGKVDDSKLAEIRTSAEKGNKYQTLVDEPKNELIKSADKKDIDQAELTKAIEAKKAAEDAIKKLGVADLGATLDGKLGGKRLDEIPDNKTLAELIEESKKSKELLDKAGIKVDDPNAEKHAEDLKNTKEAVENAGLEPSANIGKQITDLKEKSNRLEIIVKGIYGKEYEAER